MKTHRFLSDDWVEAARALRAEYTDRLPAPPFAVRINVVVTRCPHETAEIHGHIDTSGGEIRLERGHLDDPELTMTVDYDTAYTLFVGRDPQASMAAFFSGKILVDGDVSRILALQTPVASPALDELNNRLKAMTER